MLQPAIAATRRVQQEHVTIEVLRCPEQLHVMFAQGLQIVAQARHVGARIAAYRDRVWNTASLKLADRQRTYLDGMVNQFGIVDGAVLAESVLLRIDWTH